MRKLSDEANTLRVCFVIFIVVFIAGTVRAVEQEPFTSQSCISLCAPLPVRMFKPGFCRISDDEYNLVRCEGKSSTENVVPIFDVCSCGNTVGQ